MSTLRILLGLVYLYPVTILATVWLTARIVRQARRDQP